MNKQRMVSLALCITLCAVALALVLFMRGDRARAQATTRYVATSGTDSGDCMDPNNPCRTVQYAVDVANDGDLIKVATGVYTGVQGRPVPPEYSFPPTSRIINQVVYISKAVTIRGGFATPEFADPPDPEVNPSTLDAQGQGRVLFVCGNTSPTIGGLRITGGDAAGLGGGEMLGEGGGGGLYLLSSDAMLNGNIIISNTAERGGGLYLQHSDATLSSNTVISNTADGSGGGLWLSDSTATLSGNTISGNSANFGGGLRLYYSGATLVNNIITDNQAKVAGGGLGLHSSPALLSGNTISSNTADLGGGLQLYYSGAKLSGNTISGNTADDGGGGLWLEYSKATLSRNTVTSNTADGAGGGLYLANSDATLNGNTVTSNTADRTGGGLIVYDSDATLNGNTINGNTANDGGGLWLMYSDATLVNNIIADNQANSAGSGLYTTVGTHARLLHSTIARNHGGDGSGVSVNGRTSTVALTDTILVSHTAGISVAMNSIATLESTLWGTDTWANDTDWGGLGTIVTGTVNIWGDPAFVDPPAGDYHIGPGSAALDVGVDVGVHIDIDHQPRPYLAPDLGADEYWPPGVLKHVHLPLVLRGGP